MSNTHLVAIFGGAVSGAEAAHQFAERGISCVVFDQNPLPFGKIEDGLPKWHVKLRDKEIGRISEKLSHPLVHFVPSTGLGRELQFEDVVNDWGFSAVVLATGAWRDRPLPLEGVERFVGHGLYYQNPFIYWFNHKHEPDFDGAQFEIADGVGIIGGGLASLDVAKVLMFETVLAALRERGHDVSLFELDRSIAKVLDAKGLTLDQLGVRGCTLYYRRRIKDMPLSPFPVTSPETRIKAETVREKILNNYRNKYLFQVCPLHVPVSYVEDNGHLTAIVFQETEIVDGRAKPVPGSEKTVHAPYFVSSIGSIPELIPGIPASGSVYDVADDGLCRLRGYTNVFAIGNAVTGRGNINESLKHGREISQKIIQQCLDDVESITPETHLADQMEVIANAVDGMMAELKPVHASDRAKILERVKSLQADQGYTGSFQEWATAHLPVRLESMIGGH